MLTNTARKGHRRTARPSELQKRILDCARELFFSTGQQGVTARKVAARASCSATAIYLHFDGIDDVLHRLRMEGHALLARYFGAWSSKASALSRIEAMGRAYYRFGLENPRYYELMFLARSMPRRGELQREMYTLMLLRDVVKAGVDRKEIRRDLDPTMAANVLWSQIHGVTSLAVRGLLWETAPRTHRQVVEHVLEGARLWLTV